MIKHFITRTENIKGKEETPFLLKRIAELTKGESLSASESFIKEREKKT